MTFSDFLTIFNNLDEPDETYITIPGFSISGDKAEIILRILNPYTETPVNMKFRVEITGIEDYKIVKPDSSFIDLKTEHPILWNFDSPHGSLYFSGKLSNTKSVLADLYKVNDRLFGGLLPFETYFNRGLNVLNVLGAHSGLIASGPVKILDCYAEVLAKYDVTHSIIETYHPTYRDGSTPIQRQVLLIGGCYFVGQEFDFLRID